ncbi:hypothetical protein [Ornithinibacillus californiensis]|uniref:hypothetical protein n=1 Tax=Ornithinibacillus californiensis TaxID=161536 RepID=UPI0012EE16E1|nr:hypothetical protein [Ornithinibacillus californiensis]
MSKKIGLTITIIVGLLFLASCGVPERVEYSGRSYEGPTTYTVKEFNEKFGEVQAVGDKVDGMEVMDSNESQKVLEEQGTVPTLLFLKKSEEEYIVYSLQGGT